MQTPRYIMDDYQQLKALHYSLPAFSPIIPTGLLPYLTPALLIPTFALAFYLSIIPTRTIPIWETTVASVASILGGFGVVALFCSVGVYV